MKDRISSIESNGFENVREDVEKTKESVKELNSELTEIKSNLSSTPQESNISSPQLDQAGKSVDSFNDKLIDSEKLLNDLNNLLHNLSTRNLDSLNDKYDNIFNLSNRDELDSKFKELQQIQRVIKQLTRKDPSRADDFIQAGSIGKEGISTVKSYIPLLEKLGYTLGEIQQTKSGTQAKIIPIDDKAITNGKEMAEILLDINSLVSNQKKDAFPKTSENLEQVAQSEQKVQQEAVATDKALNNISFTPNTEGFEDIITKFGILREQAEQITKIVKTTKQTADGTSNISYKATLRNGSSYYLGENSTPQVLNASETVYDAKTDNTKKLEREKQIWNELTTSLERYATIQKRIASNNALSTDNEEAIKLLEHIHELQRNDILPTEKLTASNEKLQQINQTVTDLKAKLKESTLDSLQGSIDKYQKIYDQRKTYSSDFTPSEQYTKNLTGLNTAIGNLVEYRNTLKNVSEVTVEQEAELKGLVTACEKASDSFKSLSASEKGASQIAIDKLVQRINKDLDECTNYSKEAKLGLRALRDELESANPRNLKEITSEIINIENAEIKAGRAGRSFFDTLKNSGFHQIAAQMAGMFGLYDVINIIKQAASTVTELNTQITELAKVSEQSSSQIYADFDSYADIAKEVRGTISDTIAATADWSKNGYSIPDAKKLAEVSQLYKNVGDGIDINTANESLISTLKGFQLEADQAEHIVDVFNEVDLLASYYSNVIALCIHMHIDSNYIG